MKYHITFLFWLTVFCASAQLPKWVLGSSQQNSSGTYYSYGTGNLKFYEVNFKGSLSSSPRTIGASIQTIKSVGTQDVMQTAVDTTTNTVLFYVFAAATGPLNMGFPTISPDTIYFAAYNSSTGADEIFGKMPSTGWGASVIESELVQKPGSSTEYYFIYKTQATSNYLDYIRYVTVDIANKTVSAPTNLVTAEKTGEGMAVSQLNCSNQRWLFTTRPESNGNITLRRCTISNSGITPAIDTYTISIPGNSTNVVVGVEIAPTNNYLAVGNYNNTNVNKNMILFDYNNSLGSVSNERYYKNGLNYPFVTMEFSPNGSRVYILQGGSGSVPNVIYNCPVSSSNFTVTAANQMGSMTLNQSLTLETAYDGNIYVNPGTSSNFMYVINNPNSATPTITSTGANFFGSNDRIGEGFPDQVDGDKYAKGSINLSIVASDISLCSGQSTTLTASGANSYQWSEGSIATTSVITDSPVVTTTYVVTGTVGICTARDSVVVQVTPTPTASITGNLNLCAGQTTTLTASGGTTYQWSGGSNDTTSVITVSPSVTTSYTVMPSNGSCNGNPVAITVSVTPNPTVAITPGSISICPGETATLTASGGTSWQWSGGSTATTSVIVVHPDAESINYTVTASDGACSANAVATVSVSPTITITPAATNICSGQPVTITASGGTTYQWSGGSTATSSVITVNPANTTTYVVTVTSGSCSASDSVTILVDPTPTVNVAGNQVICPGQTDTLTASGGSSYQWSGGSSATTAQIIVSPIVTTTYSVTTTTGPCTSSQAAVMVTVPAASVSITASDTMPCAGQPTTIIASGGSTYQWSGASSSTNDTLVVSPTNTSTYVVTASNGTCTASDSITIQVAPSSTASVSGNQSICSGQTTTLTATGSSSYQWSGGSTATTSVIIVSPTVTTDYTVTPFNGNCAGIPAVITVSVTVTPTVAVIGTQTICSGQTATLTASGGASSYQWFTGITSTNDTVFVSPTNTTTYSVTSANGACASVPATFTVSVTPTPTITVAAAPSAVCSGQSSTLTASGASSYQWSGGSSATTSVIVVNPGSTTNYTVTGANGSCPGDSASASIGVIPTPTITISPAQTICSGQTATITATGASSYQWSGGSLATTGVIIVSPTTTTTYTVTGSNANCPGAPASTTVAVIAAPVLSVSGNQNICAGQTTTLTVTGASTYQWSGGSTATTSVIVVSPAVSTNYVVVGSNGNCPGAPLLITVNVTPLPTVLVGGDQTICSGSTATLTASGGTTYQWIGNTGTGSIITVAPTGTTSYTVLAVNGNCVSAPAIVTVSVVPTPTISVTTSDSVLCTGHFAVLTASGASSYQWSSSSSTLPVVVVSPSVTTTYTVSAVNSNCIGNASITIPVLPFVPANFTYSFTNCLPPTVVFSNQSAATPYWDFGDGTNSSQNAPIHSYSSGTYLALMITNAGTLCADTSGHNINVVFSDHAIIPNIFTPNGDGINDELTFAGLDPCKEYELTIYNRWGQKIFETPEAKTTFWNGTIHEKNADDDTYFFILQPMNSKDSVIKGYITIIR